MSQGIAQSLYYTSSGPKATEGPNEFMEAGKALLSLSKGAGWPAARRVVRPLARSRICGEACALKECMADLTFKNRLLQKA